MSPLRSRSNSPGEVKPLEKDSKSEAQPSRPERSTSRDYNPGPPKRRSRSQSREHTSRRDYRRSRSRSRSPPRQPKSSDNLGKAFKWKNKGSRGDGRDERDYRRRDDDNYRPKRYGGRDDRERRSERDRDLRTDDKFGGERRRDRDREGDNGGSKNSVADKFGPSAASKFSKNDAEKPKKPAAPAMSVTYIIVTVNDRLGTKASIPCLSSDTVGDFKKMVAAHIGRQPHEIMLKRQGERPFKDFITLGDYGVGNGVQLDLELGTGD